MLKEFPALFEATLFPEISIVANDQFKPGSTSLNVVDAKINSDLSVNCVGVTERRFIGELHVSTSDEVKRNIPYKIDILCVVSLRIIDSVPVSELENVAVIATHAVAFPAIRELILSLTARQPWGQFSIGMSTLKSSKESLAKNSRPKKRPRLKTSVNQ